MADSIQNAAFPAFRKEHEGPGTKALSFQRADQEAKVPYSWACPRSCRPFMVNLDQDFRLIYPHVRRDKIRGHTGKV
jgi:hypothetical protein